MYEVQHKDTILPPLPVAKRGYALNSYLAEVLQCTFSTSRKLAASGVSLPRFHDTSPLAMSSMPCNRWPWWL